MKTKCVTTIKNQKNKEYKCSEFVSFIIICDSPGYRMKSYGASPLLDIGNLKLLDIQIKAIKNCFTNFEIILCVGFDSSSIIKYVRNNLKNINIRIVENQLYEQTNSCESLRLSLNNICNNKVFVLDGSLVLNENIFHNFSTKDNVLFSQTKQNDFEIGFNINENNVIEHVSFGASNIWSEILYTNNATDGMKKLLFNGSYKKKLIFELINDLIQSKYSFKAKIHKHNLEKVNNIKTYHNLRK